MEPTAPRPQHLRVIQLLVIGAVMLGAGLLCGSALQRLETPAPAVTAVTPSDVAPPATTR